MIFSCYGCQERQPTCHSSCERYLREKAEHEAWKAEDDKKKAISFRLTAQRCDSVRRASKKKSTRKGRNKGVG